jgi:hypothetical protein
LQQEKPHPPTADAAFQIIVKTSFRSLRPKRPAVSSAASPDRLRPLRLLLFCLFLQVSLTAASPPSAVTVRDRNFKRHFAVKFYLTVYSPVSLIGSRRTYLPTVDLVTFRLQCRSNVHRRHGAEQRSAFAGLAFELESDDAHLFFLCIGRRFFDRRFFRSAARSPSICLTLPFVASVANP